MAARVVARAAAGATVAVVSDAGMPGISDPGERLVGAAVAAGVTVRVVPGPLRRADRPGGIGAGRRSGSASRASCPGRAGKGPPVWRPSPPRPRTTVLYEAPHRVARTLERPVGRLRPDRPVARRLGS